MKPKVTRAELSKVPCLYDTRRVANARIRVLCKHISGRVRVRLCVDEGLHVARELLRRRIVTAEAGWNAYYRMPEAGIRMMVNSNGGHGTFDGH